MTRSDTVYLVRKWSDAQLARKATSIDDYLPTYHRWLVGVFDQTPTMALVTFEQLARVIFRDWPSTRSPRQLITLGAILGAE